MSEKDVTDPKGMHPEARKQHRDHARAELRNRIDRALHTTLEEVGERMFREGVIAGLRVREERGTAEMLGAGLLIIRGSLADLALVTPPWCECDPRQGYTCSPLRRPATCDISAQRDAEADADAWAAREMDKKESGR